MSQLMHDALSPSKHDAQPDAQVWHVLTPDALYSSEAQSLKLQTPALSTSFPGHLVQSVPEGPEHVAHVALQGSHTLPPLAAKDAYEPDGHVPKHTTPS
jgi:hypothetical protein